MNYIKRWLLRLVLGNRTYNYMCLSLAQDPRLKNCKLADIIVRKDGFEKRIEADWLKKLYRIVQSDLPTPIPQSLQDLVGQNAVNAKMAVRQYEGLKKKLEDSSQKPINNDI